MKWARNIVGVVAIAVAVDWVVGELVNEWVVASHQVAVCTTRSGLRLGVIVPPGNWYPTGVYIMHYPRAPFWSLPSFEAGRGWWQLSIPHWLLNLVAWSLFFALWRRARRYPEGRCQKCGYDSKGNESGVCPECGESLLLSRKSSSSG